MPISLAGATPCNIPPRTAEYNHVWLVARVVYKQFPTLRETASLRQSNLVVINAQNISNTSQARGRQGAQTERILAWQVLLVGP